MRKTTQLIASLALAAGFTAGSAQAELAGHPVVLVHGFQPANLLWPPASQHQVEQNGAAYWAEFWGSRADARIDWDSTQRLEEGIAVQAYAQMKDIAERGVCATPCVFVTHSTGDLVTRYLLENQAAWLAADGLPPLQVLAVLDFAGAGGGTELADLAMSIAYNNSWYLWPAKEAVKAILGFDPVPSSMGVVNDLQVNQARSQAVAPSALPRLRFVGAGSEYLGVTKPFIRGADDSVVPVHSACGAAIPGDFDSCSSTLSMAGMVTGQAAGALWHNHFPVLLSEGVHHSGTIGHQRGNVMVPVVNNTTLNGLSVAFDSRTYQARPWWKLFGSKDTYIEVPGSANSSMSALVYDTMN